MVCYPPSLSSFINFKIFQSTLGIGNVDQALVKCLAEAGSGTCSILSSNDIDQLEKTVIEIMNKYIQCEGEGKR